MFVVAVVVDVVINATIRLYRAVLRTANDHRMQTARVVMVVYVY